MYLNEYNPKRFLYIEHLCSHEEGDYDNFSHIPKEQVFVVYAEKFRL